MNEEIKHGAERKNLPPRSGARAAPRSETRRAAVWFRAWRWGGRALIGTLIALGSMSGARAGTVPLDPHWLPLPEWQDADHDFLTTDEERGLGWDPANPDENHNNRPDGVDRALAAFAQLDALPVQPSKETPWVEHHEVKGLERCQVCGELINMGHLTVINPREKVRLDVPYMARHFLAHGAFSYTGTEHEGRLDPAALDVAMNGQGDSHWLPVKPDADHDFLADGEEADLHRDPANPDEDRNGVPDGVDLARRWAKEVRGLPADPQPKTVYRLEFRLRGLERCGVCGERVNLGHCTVVNPRAGLYAKLPYLALHTMERGGFSFAGNMHGRGRAALWLLDQALHSEGPRHWRPLEEWEDPDQDGLLAHEEARFGFEPDRTDSDLDGVPDGFAVARALAAAVNALPTAPNGTCYAVDHRLRGLVACEVCGARVNMGWREVINPREELQARVSYLALHALRHGSLTYTPRDRLNPCLLDVALHGNGTSHLVLGRDDADQDGLRDREEALFGMDPEQPDTDGDGVLDGVQLARRLHARVAALPDQRQPGGTWAVPIWADCDAPCPVCGEMVNRGFLETTNDWSGQKISAGFLALHYLEHGSFSHAPDQRIDPLRLAALLQPAVRVHCAADRITLRWLTRKGRRYELHVAPAVNGPWNLAQSWKGDGSEIEYRDPSPVAGRERFYRVVVYLEDAAK